MNNVLLGKFVWWDTKEKAWNTRYCQWCDLRIYPEVISHTIEHLMIFIGYKYKAIYHAKCKSLFNKCKYE